MFTRFARRRAVRAHSRFDSCVSRTVVHVVLRVSRVPFARAVACRSHESRVLPRVSFASVTRVVRMCCRAPFACVARLAACRSRVVRALSRLCPRVAHIVFARRASLIRLA